VYSGTGSLAVSGTVPIMAAHVAVLRECPGQPVTFGYGQPVTPTSAAEPFDVLAVGAGCVIDGRIQGTAFYPDLGTTCRLRFAEGTRVLRVTDVSLEYAAGGDSFGRMRVDLGVVHVEVGGSDAATGARAVYHFSGTSVDEPSVFPSCDDERAKRSRPSAAR
jgi:hypothetical protein